MNDHTYQEFGKVTLMDGESYVRRIASLQIQQTRKVIERELLDSEASPGMICAFYAEEIMQSFFERGSWPKWAYAENELNRIVVYFAGPEKCDYRDAPGTEDVAAAIFAASELPVLERLKR